MKGKNMQTRLIQNSCKLCIFVLLYFTSLHLCNSQSKSHSIMGDSIFVDKIVFYSQRGGDADIYMINTDGTGEVRLTTNNYQDIAPNISPDGNHIVFTSNRDGNYEIYKMKTDGTEVVRLTNTSAEEAYPFWSSDNTKIIFCSKRDGGNFEIYVMNVDGSNQTRITNTGTNEEWAYLSPSMNKIVYGAGNFPNFNVYVCDANGNNPQVIAQGGHPKWSRDGNKIAHNKLTFINNIFEGDFYVINPDGTEPRKVTNSPQGKVSESPYWSPEGTRFVFQSNITGNFQIYIIDSTGNNQRRVTNHSGNDYWPSWGRVKVPLKKYLGQAPPDSIPKRFPPANLLANGTWWWHGSPVFSPDGTEMYFVKYVAASNKTEIYYMKFINGEWTGPFKPSFASNSGDNSPIFSPDANRLLFVSGRDGSGKIYEVFRTDTGWSAPTMVDMDYQSLPGGMGAGSCISMTLDETIYLEGYVAQSSLDLYRSPLTNGRYSQFEKLPPEINSSTYDATPYIDPQERYLIFSSRMPGGYGDYDLYISFRKPDGSWMPAQNLGSRFNGQDVDAMPSISYDGKYFFFNTAKTGDLGYNPYWSDISFIDKMCPTANHLLNHRSGWNMISIPVDSVYIKNDLFPSSISSAYFYDPDSADYIIKDTLETGKSYWLKFPSSGIVKLYGDSVYVDSFDVKPGWNMIGSISKPVPVMTIASNPPGLITSRFFTYQSGYVMNDTIIPGAGYWVKVSQGGKLLLSSEDDLSSSNRIIIIPDNETPPLPPDKTSSVNEEQIPIKYKLYQNYPNPFNPFTKIKFILPGQEFVTMKIFNVLGNEIEIPFQDMFEAGVHEVVWSGATHASGVYFYQLTTDKFKETRKMILTK